MKLVVTLLLLCSFTIGCSPPPSERDINLKEELGSDNSGNSELFGGKTSSDNLTGNSESVVTNSEVAVTNNEVIDPNSLPPTIVGQPQRLIFSNSEYKYLPEIIDPNSDTLQISGINIPSWLSLDPLTGALTGIASNSDLGAHNNIYINVSDGSNKVSQGPFSITVQRNNSVPVIFGEPSREANEGGIYQFLPVAQDVDQDLLEFEILNKPADLQFNPKTGELTGVFSFESSGTYSDISIGVSDGIVTIWLEPFTLEVNHINQAPTISGIPTVNIIENNDYLFEPNAIDLDGDSLMFSARNLPSWLEINGDSGSLSGRPTSLHVDQVYADIELVVTDGYVETVLPSFSIRVRDLGYINSPPTIAPEFADLLPSDVMLAFEAFNFKLQAIDVDGDVLLYSMRNNPDWLKFDDIDRSLVVGSPTNGDVGTYSDITLSVRDKFESVDLIVFDLTVIKVNSAPTISGNPPIVVVVGQEYNFTPIVNDIDIGDSISYAIQNKPTWLAFDIVTGTLSATPSAPDISEYSNIILSASDGTDTVSLPPFSIKVLEGNTPPVIEGNPLSDVAVGQEFLFTPIAYDPDNDPNSPTYSGPVSLTYSINKKLQWIKSFNTSNGALRGTPTADDVGHYSGVVISVSDGVITTSLPEFSITVNPLIDTGGGSLVISGLSQSSYELDILNSGTTSYIDRNYEISNIPDQYLSSNFIRTRNDDKFSATDNFLSFNLSVDADVYVAFDIRISSLPDWMADWSATGFEILVNGSSHIIYKKHYLAGPVSLGGNYGNLNTSMYLVFTKVPNVNVNGEVPLARADIATTADNQDVRISVLDNDENLADTPITISIDSQPVHGSVVISGEGIIFSPTIGFVGNDSFIYRLTDVNGDFSIATVDVNITCGLCLNNVVLELNWQLNPLEEDVRTYKVYHSINGSFDILPTRVVNTYDSNFDMLNPTVTFDAGLDLGLKATDEICFSISAVNVAGESAPSNEVCETM